MSPTKEEIDRVMRDHERTVTRQYTVTKSDGEQVRRAHIRCANRDCDWEEDNIPVADHRAVEEAKEHHVIHVLGSIS